MMSDGRFCQYLSLRLLGGMLAAMVLYPPWAVATAPLGQSGLTATYRLDADPNDRPGYEKKNRESVVELSVALGSTDLHGGRDVQWFEMP